jgi:cytochrome b561
MTTRYTRTARTLHWLLVILLLEQLIFGWWLGDVPRNTPDRGFYINLHKSIGMLIGLVILLRIVWRLTHAAPALPDFLPDWKKRLSVISHYGMYLCMLIMPLSGYVASNFSKHGVKFFNTLVLLPWGSDDKQVYAFLNQTHKLTAVILVILVALHVLAALQHGLRRDGIIHRMWIRPF